MDKVVALGLRLRMSEMDIWWTPPRRTTSGNRRIATPGS